MSQDPFRGYDQWKTAAPEESEENAAQGDDWRADCNPLDQSLYSIGVKEDFVYIDFAYSPDGGTLLIMSSIDCQSGHFVEHIVNQDYTPEDERQAAEIAEGAFLRGVDWFTNNGHRTPAYKRALAEFTKAVREGYGKGKEPEQGRASDEMSQDPNNTPTLEPQKGEHLVSNVILVITRARISDLLCCALEGGSNYWYHIKEQKEPERFEFRVDEMLHAKLHGGCPAECEERKAAKPFPHLDYPLNPGGSLTIIADSDHGAEEINGKTSWVLDLAAIEAGLSLMAKVQPDHFYDFLKEEEDATTGDVFLQLCLFGEVVFC